MAQFDPERRLVWSSGLEPLGATATALGRLERGARYERVLATWFSRLAAPTQTDESRGVGVSAGAGRRIRRCVPWNGRVLHVVQRRTPDGGTLVVFLDRTEDERRIRRVLDERLLQIMTNLGSNGIKYNRRPGSVTFALSVPHTGIVRISVSDTGVGIPVDEQATLVRSFGRRQPFERATGRGLGLRIARGLAELMGGQLGFAASRQRAPSSGWTLPECAPA
jgi:hypothetical protein